MKAVNLKARILAPLSLVSVLVLAIFVAGQMVEENEHIGEDFTRSVQALQGFYQAALKERARKLMAALDVITSDVELRTALKATDRDALLAHAQPLFQRLKTKHGITHFYFHDPHGVNLLRVHQPGRYGDTITRFTLLAAERTGEVAYGVELGPLGTFTLRAVSPVREHGRILGYVELGEEVDRLVGEMASAFGAELYVAIDKHSLKRAEWEAGMRMLGRNANWDLLPGLVIVSDTLPAASQALSKLLMHSPADYPPDDTEVAWEGRHYRMAFVALRDAGDHEVGKLLVLRDMTARINSNYASLFLTSVGALLLGSLLFGFFYFVLDQAERDLSTRRRPLAKNGDSGPQRRDMLMLLLTLVVSVFLVELAIMLLLPMHLSRVWVALIDAAALVIILHPLLYLFVVRPIARHIHLRRQAELAAAHLGRTLDHSTNEIYMFDATHLRFIEVSQGARDNLGYTMDELKQLTPLDLNPDFTHDQFEVMIAPLRRGEELQTTFEAEQRRKDGTHYPVEVHLHLDSAEIPAVFVAVTQDISERKHYIAELEHKALYDALTDLPNRSLLQDRLQQALKVAHRETQPLAVLLLDIVRLKEVNDIMGHGNGDLVLQHVAGRLQKAFREADTVARLGGDEFAIVLPAMDVEHVSIAAEKIHKIFEQPITVDDTTLEIEAAIGAALYPDHGDAPDLLLQHADIAMRLAKNEAGGFSIYDLENDPYSLRRLKLLGELRRTITEQALTLYYQPKIDIKTGRIKSVEALARWPHPTEGMISPADFIPMVEQSGLIRPFTLWVLEQAIDQYRRWAEAGIDLTVAVNLSTRNLLDPGLPDRIEQLLESNKVSPACLMLEITESAVMSRPENALKVLTRLHAMGLKLSIDDFGTGYSSLAYLQRLPVDELKIDYSFISSMTKNEGDSVIVRSTIDLAHNLGLNVVAEGVEDKDILSLLAILRCDIAQGYYFSRPIPAQELEQWLINSPWGLGSSG